MNSEPTALNQVNHSMWQVINRALDKSPALRFSSAQEMIDAIDQASKPSVVLDSPMPPPGQTIYGAGGAYPAPPPVLSPYGQAYGAPQLPAPNAPPIVYPYNPYQQGMGGGVPPHTPGYGQTGFPQGPIYYPPPPRQPLFKAETKHFIGKLLLSLLVMGTLVAVVVLFVAGIGQAIEKNNSRQKDSQTMVEIAKEFDSKASASEKIQKLEQLIAKLNNAEYRTQERRQLAVLYEKEGQDLMQRGDPGAMQAAENPFKRANELDPENPKLMSDLAALYANSAAAQAAVADRSPLYDQSIEWWGRAANASGSDQQAHDQYLIQAGQVYLAKATDLLQASYTDPSLREQASDTVKLGLATVPISSTVYKQLSDLDTRISQG
jgi:tetratricopeptide (TPR) repeat protein